MRLRVTLAVMGGALLAVACSDSSTPITQPPAPSFLDVVNAPGRIHVMPTRAIAAGLDNRAKPGGKGSNTGIFYHGGPILLSTKVAAIYWGTSTIYQAGPAAGTSGNGSQDGSLIGHFLRNFGGSPYFNINHVLQRQQRQRREQRGVHRILGRQLEPGLDGQRWGPPG
jgi:hypothetical protein